MIKVADVAYGRLQAPDLDRMEAFLTVFGLVRAERTSTALYMRGTDPEHHIHVTKRGEPRFLGIAFHAEDGDDLERLSRLEGATPVETIDAPGGGRRVRLTDPNGIAIEVVHGIASPVSNRVSTRYDDSSSLRSAKVHRLKSMTYFSFEMTSAFSASRPGASERLTANSEINA